MGFNYLIDTNILIYASKGLLPEESLSKTSKIFRNFYNISIISEIELLRCKNLNEEKFLNLKKFIEISKKYEVSPEIRHKTIEVRRNTNLKTPDAIIAATAIVNNMILVTRNNKDFHKVEGLEIYNPFDS